MKKKYVTPLSQEIVMSLENLVMASPEGKVEFKDFEGESISDAVEVEVDDYEPSPGIDIHDEQIDY